MIDAFASAAWYVDHIAPVWLALPREQRGTFYLGGSAPDAARGLPGIRIHRVTADQVPILTVSYGDFRAATMAGRPMIALGQHGAGQSYSGDHPAYPGGRGQDRASLFLVPNDHAAARTRHAYPRARVELVGCPKLDGLPRKDRDGEPVVAVSFHWDGPAVAPEMRSAWDHYRAALPALAREYRVIGHAHPRSIAVVGRAYRQAGIEVVPSFVDVLRRADVYVVDNSSSLFEFAATGRPVVVLNRPDFRRNVEHGLRFWAASTVGVNCDGPADLAAAVARAIEDPPEVRRAREAALDLVYRPRSGGAELAAIALVDWASVWHVRIPPPRREVRGPGRFHSVRAVRPIAVR
jgi:hypothetical protein